MSENIVVVAHFDADDKIDENFAQVLFCLEKVFDVVLLITTSAIAEEDIVDFVKVKLIRRPNVGYDFYSYRVGYEYAVTHFVVQSILFTNSSYFVTDDNKFTSLLVEMQRAGSEYDVVGLTSSQQIAWHVQSYMLLISGGLSAKEWFAKFMRNVQPQNTKFEVILNYEIGLSQKMLGEAISPKILFQADAALKISAYKHWFSKIVRNASGYDWMSLKVFRGIKDINWTHFAAAKIAQQYGVVKAEVLRTNPHSIDKDLVLKEAVSESIESIHASINRSSRHYQVTDDGLSELVQDLGALPSYRSVRFGVSKKKGVSIAVVLHLYYYDLLKEIKQYLGAIVEPFDLYVTTPFEGDVHKIIDDCADLAASVTVHISENRGRDIGPFLVLYLNGALDDYEAVLKLHSKKSKYSQLGEEWRKSIYDALMKDSFTVRKILQLIRCQDVGLVGPHPYYLSNDNFWGANRTTVNNLLLRTGVVSKEEEVTLGFFAGSMFWFSPLAIIRLKTIPVNELFFVHENGMQDGTLAHALERIFCPLVRAEGYSTTSLKLAGAEIDNTETKNNKVPVL